MSNIQDSSQLDRCDVTIETDSDIRIEIMTDHQVTCQINSQLVRAAVLAAANERGFKRGNIGIRITDDATIHRINQVHLGHDYPTDVISFDYGSAEPTIDGEMVVSADMAAWRAAELGWPMDHELALYIVHGTLHIAGFDDISDSDRESMRAAEQRVMISLGIEQITRFGPASTRDADAETRQDESKREPKCRPREEQA